MSVKGIPAPGFLRPPTVVRVGVRPTETRTSPPSRQSPSIRYQLQYHLPSSIFSTYKSTNGGATWNHRRGPVVLHYFVSNRSPKYPNHLRSNNNSGGGVLKSIDGGATWNSINNGLDTAAGNRVVVDPVNTSTIYAGTNVGVFKSTDGGGSWTSVLTTGSVSNLTIDPASPSTVYAMGFSSQSAIFKSSNAGTSWTQLGAGVILSAGRLLINPQASNTLYVLGNPGFGDQDAFVSKFTSAGDLAYSTYLGGSQSNTGDTSPDQGFAIAADAAGNAYVTGLARSKDFPVTADSYQP